MLTCTNTCGSLNLIGMRRNGMDKDAIARRKWVYKTLYRTGHSLKTARETLEAKGDDPIVREYLDFLDASDKAICHGVQRPNRGGAS